jgi:hypothetical protein
VGKLQVGDVEIDGRMIRIRGSADDLASAERRPPADPDPLRVLKVLGITPRAVFSAGGALIGIGVAVFCLTSGPLDVLAMITRGGVLISSGLGLAGYGLFAMRLASSCASEERRARQVIDGPYAETVSKLIQKPDPRQTLEWIEAQSGLSPSQVVRGLALLRERGDLMEDLDTVTDSFWYWATPRSQSLDTRLKMLGDVDEK